MLLRKKLSKPNVSEELYSPSCTYARFLAIFNLKMAILALYIVYVQKLLKNLSFSLVLALNRDNSMLVCIISRK
jgi:hypothetical protein